MSSSLWCLEVSKWHKSVLCSVGSDRVLFELADQVGVVWNELAIDVGMKGYNLDAIEEAANPKDQALKMLRLLHAKMSHTEFNVDEVRARLQKIKRKRSAEN